LFYLQNTIECILRASFFLKNFYVDKFIHGLSLQL